MKLETIHEKGSGALNEDNILIGDNIFGVFDGATSLDKFVDTDGRTGGLIASSEAKDAFENNNRSLIELVEIANASIKKEMIKRGIDMSKKENLWSTSVAVIKIMGDFFEWVQIGDSLILVIFRDNTFKLLVNDYDHDEETLVMWKKLADKNIENIGEKLREQFLKVRKTMNVAYGILNGEDEMRIFLNKGSESLENVKSVVIFTDGLIMPKENPTEKDKFDLFVKLFNDGGLNKVRDYIRSLEMSDAGCYKYPRFKQCDDIGAVAITF